MASYESEDASTALADYSAEKSEDSPVKENNEDDDPRFINFETISLPEDLLDMWGMFEGWDPFWICVAGAVICLLLMVCSSNILLPLLMVC